MTMVSSCLSVDPVKRPGTEQLSKFSLFTHDNFNIWFVQELQEKLNEEFSSNPLLKTRKSLPSPSMIKGTTVDIPSKRSSEKVTVVRNINAQISKVLWFVNFHIFCCRKQNPEDWRVWTMFCLMKLWRSLLCTLRNIMPTWQNKLDQTKTSWTWLTGDTTPLQRVNSRYNLIKLIKQWTMIFSSPDNTDGYLGW